MNNRLVQGGLLVALAGGGVLGGPILMDATLSRHEEVPAGSELVVEMTIATRSGVEADNEDIARALIGACRLEVRSDVAIDEIEPLADHHYRFVLRPGLDESDRRQLTGCIQDFQIDNVLANVVSLRQR